MRDLKKPWIILLVILLAELIPFSLMLIASPPGLAMRLYGFDPSHWIAWVAAAAIAFGYAAYAAGAFPLIRQNLLTLNSMKIVAVVFALVTGTVEEVYFRKALMDWAAHRDVGAVGQVVFSAILFGAAHGVWGVFARQWRMASGAAIATGILGGLLAIVYLLAGRDVAPCVWAHVLINLVIEPWLILAAVAQGERQRRPQFG